MNDRSASDGSSAGFTVRYVRDDKPPTVHLDSILDSQLTNRACGVYARMVRRDGQRTTAKDLVRPGESLKLIRRVMGELIDAGWIRYQTVMVPGQRWPLHCYDVFESPRS